MVSVAHNQTIGKYVPTGNRRHRSPLATADTIAHSPQLDISAPVYEVEIPSDKHRSSWRYLLYNFGI